MRESYIKNNHTDLYNDIMNYIDLEVPFKEKLWYFYNKVEKEVLCKCGNKTSFERNFKKGYKKYCSSKCAQSSKVTKEKRKRTVMKKYGVDNVSKNSSIKEKIQQTNLERYGFESSFQNEDVRNKWKNTIHNKYGVDHIFQLDNTKDKIQSTMIEKYGDHYTKTSLYRDKLNEIGFSNIIKKKKLEKHSKYFRDQGFEFLEIQDYKKFKLRQGDDVFEIHWDTFISRLENGYEISTNKNPLYFSGISKSEEKLSDWIKSITNTEVITSDRKILNGKEIDIYLPEFNLALEFNGLYWHSEINKTKKHHINKTNTCIDNGIHLIHIWEDDWNYKKEIIQSIILNKMGLISNKIYARKCEIRNVNFSDSKDFLDSNHIQGRSNSSIRYGLYYNNKLVSLMTFGYRYTNAKRTFELIRFCNTLNTNVIGGSSKLFKHFLKNNDIDELISYSDKSMFDGSMYEMLGFINDGDTSLNYWWVVDKKRYHRFKYNKNKLVSEGYDPELTGDQIMYNKGAYKIWGCGQIRWIYRK